MFLLASTVAILLLLLYTVWQLFNLWGWYKTVNRPRANKPVTEDRLPSIALLVPFRNEAENLPALVTSLLAQDYPGQLELIFIDDHSSDGGAALLPVNVTILQLAEYLKGKPTVAHKKAALTYAISTTEADIVITTDADCHWPADRISRIAAAFIDGADIVLGAVLINPTDGFCNAFQALDLAAYQFLTAATAHQGQPALANGANFAFRRSLFEAVGGYQGVDHLPSGDDVLLLHKFYQHDRTNQESSARSTAKQIKNRESRISDTSNASFRVADTPSVTPDVAPLRSDQRSPGTFPLSHTSDISNASYRVAITPRISPDAAPSRSDKWSPGLPSTTYLPKASITTNPVPNWPALWRQRLRWAGKAGNYNNPKLSFAQALAFALSLAIVLSLLTLPLHLRPRIIIVIWSGKALVDLLCLWPVMKQFGQGKAMKWYPLAALVYPFFLIGIGTAALLGVTTKWKGRQ